jgi:3-phenylpropionate/trans-cinnamate dioxygenase ferredoxin subunit
MTTMTSKKSSWVFAVEENKLEEDSLKLVNIDETPVLLVRKQGKVYAVNNRCAHMECPLSAGKLEGFIVKCPCHDWKFDIRTGEFIDAPEIKLPVYQAKMSKGKIYLKI